MPMTYEAIPRPPSRAQAKLNRISQTKTRSQRLASLFLRHTFAATRHFKPSTYLCRPSSNNIPVEVMEDNDNNNNSSHCCFSTVVLLSPFVWTYSRIFPTYLAHCRRQVVCAALQKNTYLPTTTINERALNATSPTPSTTEW